jgi:hypothetical protein
MIRDPKKFSKLQAAHYDALAEGHAPDSPGYFAAVETRIGLRKAERKTAFDPNNVRTHIRGNEVRLTKGEHERSLDGSLVWGRHDLAAGRCTAAQLNEPIGLAEMARRKKILAAQGAYDRLD